MATPADCLRENSGCIYCGSSVVGGGMGSLETLFATGELADARLILAGGRELLVHRCILAARSPFFHSVFSEAARSGRDGGSSAPGFELGELARDFVIGYDAAVMVVGYLYSESLRQPPEGVCRCVDRECPHEACWPVVEFMLEVLYASFTFQISELVTNYQNLITDAVDRVAVEDLLLILKVANICRESCENLLSKCIDMVAKSNLDVITLEKTLPTSPGILQTIASIRSELDIDIYGPNKHVNKIYMALNSGDIVLVSMLLKEGHTTLDESHALHYAVAFCDLKTAMELLELGIADVNCRNTRGYTVLHIAAMRKEPKIIVSLLTKGARTTDLTLDGRKALQISQRLTKSVDYLQVTEEGRKTCNDKLCVEILEQAERRQPLLAEASASLAMIGEEFRNKLHYYELRVALAKYYFPAEAEIAMVNARVHGTTELPLNNNIRENQVSKKEDVASFEMKEEYRTRFKVLAMTVEIGKVCFPRCSERLNKIMDNDYLTNFAFEGPEDQLQNEIRLNEIETMLIDEDFTSEEREKSTLLSSSSSTSIAVIPRTVASSTVIKRK